MMHRLLWLLTAAIFLSTQVLAEQATAPHPDWRVLRAQFTTLINNREPVDQVVVLSPPQAEVFFFTELAGLEGRTVIHRWEYQGEMVSRVPFEVKGPRWRVFSKVRLEPDQLGEWSVSVIDQSGWPLYTELFRYEGVTGSGLPAASDSAPSQ